MISRSIKLVRFSAAFILFCLILIYVVKVPLKNKVIGSIDAPLQGEILMQGNMLYNFQKGNALNFFKTDYVNYPKGENLRFVIANSFHLYAHIPLRFFFGPLESYNALMLIMFLLNFLSAYLLAAYLFSGRAAAFCSAVVFALNPYILLKMNLGFVQKIALFPVPLFLLMLFKLHNTARLRYAYFAAIFLCLMQLIYPPYSLYAVVFSLPLIAYWLWKGKKGAVAAARFGFVFFMYIFLTALIYFLMGFGNVYLGGIKFNNNISTEGCLDLFRPFLFFPYHRLPQPLYLAIGISLSCFLCGVYIAFRKRGIVRILFLNLFLFIIIAAGPYLAHNGEPLIVYGEKVLLPFYFLAKSIPYFGGIFYPFRVFPFINMSLALLTGFFLVYLSDIFKKIRPIFFAAVFLFIYCMENLILFSAIIPPKLNSAHIPEFFQKIRNENFAAILNLPVVADVRTHNLYGYYAVLSGKKMMNSYWDAQLPVYLPKASDGEKVKSEFIRTLSHWRVNYIIIHRDLLGVFGTVSRGNDEFSWIEPYSRSVLSYPEDNLLVYKLAP